ncbi:hypothetical protein Q73A0000_05135 [Kaistella flava (ex Peng et al. 2021)]|uniref:Uncharacterized protein n=1 Tax=Kaistella flava (ex Peng et al. 2021) TaxID=2038776 RepID=A0A7M2Y807_9FLAO|nr:hypothetical protein [Kaistella flava (ex Peng et al. 2021)]QOW09794.1 hypothetical protein Q73A0000_05135 [Kaistella flava (ex Peng et al. 2021)]
MRNSIIYFENNDRIVVGNISISMPTLVELQILSPFNGLVLQRIPEDSKEFNDEEQNSAGQDLIQKCFEISAIIQEHNKIIRKDFLQLLTNLENFNNGKSEIYIRNRDELLGVFMRAHFPDFNDGENSNINFSEGIFTFLSQYFISNGKCADLEITTTFTTNPKPPCFSDLEQQLKEYLAKPFEEKLFLLAQQSMNKRKGHYDWFLMQEFIENNENHIQD